jgi:hypothetical protein
MSRWSAGLILMTVAAAALAAGCGGPDTSTPEGAAEAFISAVADGDPEEACSHATEEGTYLPSNFFAESGDIPDDCEGQVEAVSDDVRAEMDNITYSVTDESEDSATVELGDADLPEGTIVGDLDLEKSGDEWLVD